MKPIGDLINKQQRLERYKGFSKPNTTPTPDDVFDIFMTELTHAELKVLLYIIRRTFGFKQMSDTVSLKQLATGIVKRNGERLDSGAGITRRGAIKAVKSLETRGLITVKRTKTEDGYNSVNVYSLRFREG